MKRQRPGAAAIVANQVHAEMTRQMREPDGGAFPPQVFAPMVVAAAQLAPALARGHDMPEELSQELAAFLLAKWTEQAALIDPVEFRAWRAQ